MLAAATSADNSVSGRVTGEMCTLTVSPSADDLTWTIGQPSSSSRARSALSAETGASVSFTPDSAGVYLITCTADGTDYVLRISVTSTAISHLVEAIRLSPKTDASIPAPSAGMMLYYSSDQDALCVKDTDDDVFTVDLTAV
jgi:hypothetical protein